MIRTLPSNSNCAERYPAVNILFNTKTLQISRIRIRRTYHVAVFVRVPGFSLGRGVELSKRQPRWFFVETLGQGLESVSYTWYQVPGYPCLMFFSTLFYVVGVTLFYVVGVTLFYVVGVTQLAVEVWWASWDLIYCDPFGTFQRINATHESVCVFIKVTIITASVPRRCSSRDDCWGMGGVVRDLWYMQCKGFSPDTYYIHTPHDDASRGAARSHLTVGKTVDRAKYQCVGYR